MKQTIFSVARTVADTAFKPALHPDGGSISGGGAQKALDSLKRIDGFTTKEISPTGLVTDAINYMMFAVAAISVIMIIIGGIRYATSGGSADKVKAAKNTILYACIGLAIALLALAIVTFVKNKVTG